MYFEMSSQSTRRWRDWDAIGLAWPSAAWRATRATERKTFLRTMIEMNSNVIVNDIVFATSVTFYLC